MTRLAPIIQFYKRHDNSSLAYVGNSVYKLLLNEFDVNVIGVENPCVNQKFVPAEIGILYGLISDIPWIHRHWIRIAGLVCEGDLTEKEIRTIKEAKLAQIWVPSAFCASKFQKAGFGDLLHLVPHGIDNIPTVNNSEITNNVLMVFSSYKVKNYNVVRKGIFETLEAIKDLPINLYLRTDFQRYYRGLIPKNVQFVNYQEDLTDLYNKVDCILSPSYSEGFGLIGLEAIARGIPLISTKTGNEYLTDDISYLNLELPVTVEKIRNTLLNFYSNVQDYKNKAQNQVELFRSRWGWNNIRESVINYLDKAYRDYYS